MSSLAVERIPGGRPSTGDRAFVWLLGVLSLLLAVGGPTLAAQARPASASRGTVAHPYDVFASSYNAAAHTYDAPARLSSPDTGAVGVQGSPQRPGAISWVRSAFVPDDVGAANTAEAAAGTAARVGPTTAHGAERIAGAGATRGGVLAEEGILLARDYGQALTQADGASVRVLQNEAGRFNVVVDGERGLITTFSNLSQKSLERLATRYGWE